MNVIKEIVKNLRRKLNMNIDIGDDGESFEVFINDVQVLVRSEDVVTVNVRFTLKDVFSRKEKIFIKKFVKFLNLELDDLNENGKVIRTIRNDLLKMDYQVEVDHDIVLGNIDFIYNELLIINNLINLFEKIDEDMDYIKVYLLVIQFIIVNYISINEDFECEEPDEYSFEMKLMS